MNLSEAMLARHSVRKYTDSPIEQEKREELLSFIHEINQNDGLHFQVCFDEPNAFKANKAHYGAFSGCRNYFALVADKDKIEEVGYFGEMLVLKAQQLGLNTCWVALTYQKGSVAVEIGVKEKLHVVISLGYGATQGVPHKNKPLSSLCSDGPDWFKRGMDAVLLAPTAINQQQFYFEYLGENKVRARAKIGFHVKMDLGIAKYHFELGAGKENFIFVD